QADRRTRRPSMPPAMTTRITVDHVAPPWVFVPPGLLAPGEHGVGQPPRAVHPLAERHVDVAPLDFQDLVRGVRVRLAGGTVGAGNAGGFGRDVIHDKPPRRVLGGLRRECRAMATSCSTDRTLLEAHVHSTQGNISLLILREADAAARRETGVRPGLEKGLVRREPEEVAADRLEVGLAALWL